MFQLQINIESALLTDVELKLGKVVGEEKLASLIAQAKQTHSGSHTTSLFGGGGAGFGMFDAVAAPKGEFLWLRCVGSILDPGT